MAQASPLSRATTSSMNLQGWKKQSWRTNYKGELTGTQTHAAPPRPHKREGFLVPHPQTTTSTHLTTRRRLRSTQPAPLHLATDVANAQTV